MYVFFFWVSKTDHGCTKSSWWKYSHWEYKYTSLILTRDNLISNEECRHLHMHAPPATAFSLLCL